MCKNKSGFSVFYLLVFVFLPIALIFLLIGGYSYITHYTNKAARNNISFDSQQWKESHLRQQMVADLKENYLYAGMSQSDITSLLGSPEYKYNDLQWEYYLPEGEFDPGDGALFLVFDDNELLKRCDVFIEHYSLWN